MNTASRILAISIAVGLTAFAARPALAQTTNATASLNGMLPEAIRKSGVLQVGIAPSFYPNAYFPPGSTTLAGLDPELLAAIAKYLGVKLNWVTADFPSLVVGVASGKFDIAMSDISDTVVRQQQVTFVDYMQSFRIAFVLAANPKNISGKLLSMCGYAVPYQSTTLAGKVIDSANKACEDAGKKPLQTISVTSNEAVQLAVESGRADFGITAGSQGAAFEKAVPGKYRYWPVEGAATVASGIATNKEATQLQQALLAALNAVRADGTYDRLLKQFNLVESGIDKFGINLSR